MKMPIRPRIILFSARFFVVVLIFFSQTLPAFELSEDDRIALELYSAAEVEYQINNYRSALEKYKKALNHRSVDGPVIIELTSDVIITAHGRKVVREVSVQDLRRQYVPNIRIKELERRIVEQERLARPPRLVLTIVSLHDPSKNNVIDAGEDATLEISVKNAGRAVALEVSLVTQADNSEGINIPKKIYIGSIPVGGEVNRFIPISASYQITDSSRKLSVRANEKSGFDSNTVDIVFNTGTHKPEKIHVTQLRLSDFSNDARIEPMEMVNLSMTVSNQGEGVSKQIKVDLILGENVFPGPGTPNSILLGKLYPSENRKIEFSFLTNNRFANGQHIPVGLRMLSDIESIYEKNDFDLKTYLPRNKTRVVIDPTPHKIDRNISTMLDIDKINRTTHHINKDAVAVVIGNQEYNGSNVPNVDYALNDARVMKSYLIHILGYKEDNILYFENATTTVFNVLFGSEKNYKGKLHNFIKPKKSDVFIYYSGHGAPNVDTNDAYFVPTDADLDYIAISGYSLKTFYENISKLPAKSLTIVLDTCFSGNSDGGVLLNNISPAYLSVKPDTFINNKITNKISIFTSASNNQVSTWYHKKRHSLFTYFFLKGLRGIADKNSDGMITTGELGSYTLSEVPYHALRITGKKQTPKLSQRNEIVLVNYRKNFALNHPE